MQGLFRGVRGQATLRQKAAKQTPHQHLKALKYQNTHFRLYSYNISLAACCHNNNYTKRAAIIALMFPPMTHMLT